MRLHTRAIIKARRPNSHFWNVTEDFGIPYEPDRAKAQQHPKVLERSKHLKALYGVVDVDFRDAS